MKPARLFTPGDIVVLAGLGAAVVGGMAWWLARPAMPDACVIQSDSGQALIPLPADTTIVIPGSCGRTTVVVKGRTARVIESCCSNKLCVRMGVASRAGALVVCAPNHVVVRLRGRAAMDAVTR